MKGSGNIMRLVRPFIKGWPLIVICTAIGLAVGYRVIYYAIPTYQTVATLQINDKESGASAFLENFEAFSMTGLILTEVEVLRSKYLMQKTLQKLDLRPMYYRYFRKSPRNLYKKSPFKVAYHLSDSSFLNTPIQFVLKDSGQIDLSYTHAGQTIVKSTAVGDSLDLEGLRFSILRDSSCDCAFSPGQYQFTLFNDRALLNQFANHNFKVVLPDKEVAIVKLAFTHEVPQLATDLVNAVAETYIEDFIYSKTQSASKILHFINQQVDTVESELRAAESALANYKARTKIVDLTLETDAQLKRISELELRRLNLNIKETELQSLLAFIRQDSLDTSLTPNYESVEDATFTDALIKLSGLQSQREELLQKYTAAHPELARIKEEEKRIKDVLRNSVENTLSTSVAKKQEIEQAIRDSEKSFGRLPDIEKELIVLRRKTMTNEQVLNFLLEKQAEAAIGANSTIAFHKLLERAPVPSVALNPQKTVILGVSVMVGMIIGLVLIFMIQYLRANIRDVKDLEDHFDFPVLGVIHRIPEEVEAVSQDFINLNTNLHLTKISQVIGVCSHSNKESKTDIVANLGKAMSAVGYRTILLDLDLYQPQLPEYFRMEDQAGLCEWIGKDVELEPMIVRSSLMQLYLMHAGNLGDRIPTTIILNPKLPELIKQLRQDFDRIILNLPPFKEVMDAIPIMKFTDLNLLVTKADRSNFPNMAKTQALLKKFQVPDMYMIFIQSQHQSQAIYQVSYEELPRMGQGVRRKMIKQIIRWMLFKRAPDGRREALPKMGSGTRRSMIKQMIRLLFSFKKRKKR